jgi:hypothetical protein
MLLAGISVWSHAICQGLQQQCTSCTRLTCAKCWHCRAHYTAAGVRRVEPQTVRCSSKAQAAHPCDSLGLDGLQELVQVVLLSSRRAVSAVQQSCLMPQHACTAADRHHQRLSTVLTSHMQTQTEGQPASATSTHLRAHQLMPLVAMSATTGGHVRNHPTVCTSHHSTAQHSTAHQPVLGSCHKAKCRRPAHLLRQPVQRTACPAPHGGAH